MFPSLGKWLPTGANLAITHTTEHPGDLLTPWVAVVALAGWTAALTIGAVRTTHAARRLTVATARAGAREFGMRFGLLGPLQVTADDGPLPLGQPRQRAILARLLVDANRVVPVDRLVDDVWGDGRPNRSAGSAHAYISNLRRILEPNRQARGAATVLVSEAPGYVLRARAEDVDASVVRAPRGRGSSVVGRGSVRCVGCVRRRARIVARTGARRLRRRAVAGGHRGPPRRAARATATEGRCTALLDLGRHAQAVPDLVAATADEPLRERLWELLMVALYRSGRQADALAAFQHVRALLGEELGIDPGPALVDLERRVLQQDPTLDAPSSHPTPVAVAPPLPTVATDRLVGRDDAVAAVVAALRTAGTGHGSAVVVSGPSGIGKTRLVEHATENTPDVGRVVWARCVEGGTAPALWPWLQVAAGLGRRTAARSPMP